jgi:hypothetical protein
MAGVLEQLIRPQKKAMSQKAMELEAAREILAEVFRVRISEVDEMIQNRFEKDLSHDACGGKDGLWPQEFWLE